MKPTLTELESRTVLNSTVWNYNGVWHVVDDGEVAQVTLPLGDPALPQYAQDHPEAFVGSPDQAFVVFSDKDNPVVLIAHADAVSNVVIERYGPDTHMTGAYGSTVPLMTSGTVTTSNITSGTTPTATTGTTANGGSGPNTLGGGTYFSAGGIHLGKHHGHHHHKPAHHATKHHKHK